MTTHAHYEGEFGARLRKAASTVEKTAQRVQKTVDVRRAAAQVARRTSTEAKKKVALAVKTQSPTHQTEAHAATKKAMTARAVLFTHDQDLARHMEAHAAAVTHHAATTALAAESERRAGFKPREMRSKIIGSPSPDWHHGDVMGRIREAEPVKPAPKPWSDTDRFARSAPPKYIPPVRAAPTQQEVNAWVNKPTVMHRTRAREDELARTFEAKTRSLESVRAADAVSLPKMTTVAKSKLVRGLDAILGNSRRMYGIK